MKKESSTIKIYTYKLENCHKHFFLGGREDPVVHRSGQSFFQSVPCQVKTKRENEWGSSFVFIAATYMLENQNVYTKVCVIMFGRSGFIYKQKGENIYFV